MNVERAITHLRYRNVTNKERFLEAIDVLENEINRQKETIQNQDEMIRALINAQETLQKATAEKDEEIEKLKSGHILYDGGEKNE